MAQADQHFDRTRRVAAFAMAGLCPGPVVVRAATPHGADRLHHQAGPRGSQNPSVNNTVGAPVFIGDPARIVRTRAEALAFDGTHAVTQAESLLMLPKCC
jgi:hypothetical protein